jgi:hypothetical protein
MPMHDWSRVAPGTYHNFHYRWIAAIMDQLNAGVLPKGCFAMAEQVIGGPEPDVVTLHLGSTPNGPSSGDAVLAKPRPKPKTSLVMIADEDRYARKTNRIVVRHELGEVLAVIELVSPGNKNSVHAIRSLVDKLTGLLFDRINLLILAPLPPTPRDPHGIHALIWNEVSDQPFELPPDRPLTFAAYQSEPIKTAWIEPLAVGATLPTMPLFLRGEFYVDLPLEPSYMETWTVLPRELRQLVE